MLIWLDKHILNTVKTNTLLYPKLKAQILAFNNSFLLKKNYFVNSQKNAHTNSKGCFVVKPSFKI